MLLCTLLFFIKVIITNIVNISTLKMKMYLKYKVRVKTVLISGILVKKQKVLPNI